MPELPSRSDRNYHGSVHVMVPDFLCVVGHDVLVVWKSISIKLMKGKVVKERCEDIGLRKR